MVHIPQQTAAQLVVKTPLERTETGAYGHMGSQEFLSKVTSGHIAEPHWCLSSAQTQSLIQVRDVQEGSPFRPQSFRRDVLDQPSAQPPSQSLAQRAGQPMGSGSPVGQRSGQPVGSSSPTAQKAGQPVGNSSPAGQRFGQLLGSRSPSKGDNAARLARMGYTESLRGSDNDSLRSFSLRSSSGNVKGSLLASLSASFRSPFSPS